MINKEEFCHIFERLKEYETKCNKVNDAMEDLFGEFSFIGYDIPHKQIIFNLLKDIFNLRQDDSTIEDWYYGGDMIIIRQDNTNVYAITDASSLYDYLIDTYDIKVNK